MLELMFGIRQGLVQDLLEPRFGSHCQGLVQLRSAGTDEIWLLITN